MIFESGVKALEMIQHCMLAVNVKGSAVSLSDLGEVCVLAEELLVAVMETMHVGKGVQEWRAVGRRSRRAEAVASGIDRIAPDLSRSVGMAAVASLSKGT